MELFLAWQGCRGAVYRHVRKRGLAQAGVLHAGRVEKPPDRLGEFEDGSVLQDCGLRGSLVVDDHLGLGAAGGHSDGALSVSYEAVARQEAGQPHPAHPHLGTNLGDAHLQPHYSVPAVRSQLQQEGERLRHHLPLLLPPDLFVHRSPLHMESDGSSLVGLVVHQDVEWTLVLLQDIFPSGSSSHHVTLPAIVRHTQVGLDQTEVGRLSLVYPVLLQHLTHNLPGRFSH